MPTDTRSVRLPLAACLTLLAAIAACGGSDEDATRPISSVTPTVAPLLQDDGQPSAEDPRARPSAATGPLRPLYASQAQARMLVDALGDRVLESDVACCGPNAIDVAVGLVWAAQAARDLPADTPVLVRGADVHDAAAAANRLGEGGMTRVWLVAR